MIAKLFLSLLVVPLFIVVHGGCPDELRDGREIFGGVFFSIVYLVILWGTL